MTLLLPAKTSSQWKLVLAVTMAQPRLVETSTADLLPQKSPIDVAPSTSPDLNACRVLISHALLPAHAAFLKEQSKRSPSEWGARPDL